MKYRQLTKEQFESLHKEFATFLASQQIDVNEWSQLKKEKPNIVEQEMNIFSDIVWEDVLTKTMFLEHYSSTHLNLFKCGKTSIHRIVVTVENKDLLNKNDFEWLINNKLHDSVTYYHASKKYVSDRNKELFELVEKGSIITQGNLYEMFYNMLKK